MHSIAPSRHFIGSLRQIFTHGLITLLAVLIAFALPSAASYIPFDWWPQVERDPNLLLASEVLLASFLVLLFNFVKIAWDTRHKTAIAALASLVYARNSREGWLARWRERKLTRQLSATRDACILIESSIAFPIRAWACSCPSTRIS